MWGTNTAEHPVEQLALYLLFVKVLRLKISPEMPGYNWLAGEVNSDLIDRTHTRKEHASKKKAFAATLHRTARSALAIVCRAPSSPKTATPSWFIARSWRIDVSLCYLLVARKATLSVYKRWAFHDK